VTISRLFHKYEHGKLKKKTKRKKRKNPFIRNKCGIIFIDRSEQQLVDCDPYDSGCEGGWYYNAWKYLHSHGSNSGYEYAYTAAVSDS